jgi:hypothetical protein
MVQLDRPSVEKVINCERKKKVSSWEKKTDQKRWAGKKKKEAHKRIN